MSSPAPALATLVAARLLDAPLAALAWILVERGVPILVAGRDPTTAASLLDALVAALPADRRPGGAAPGEAGRLVRVSTTLATDSPPGVLRAALAATSGRSGLAVAVAADNLEGVLAVLRRQGLVDDEIAFLGVVLVVGAPESGAPEGGGQDDADMGAAPRARLVAAHYLRPVVRDAGGHTRRLAPAVLATWNPATAAWEDFAWGIVPDLAERIRMRPGDLEAERERRAAALAGHAHGGPVG